MGRYWEGMMQPEGFQSHLMNMPRESRRYVLDLIFRLEEQRAEIERLKGERDIAQCAFRALRVQWFTCQLKSRAHDREWEDAEDEARRGDRNARLSVTYAKQTEGILCGVKYSVAPRCGADMEEAASAAGGE